jgi:hypothetical protein
MCRCLLAACCDFRLDAARQSSPIYHTQPLPYNASTSSISTPPRDNSAERLTGIMIIDNPFASREDTPPLNSRQQGNTESDHDTDDTSIDYSSARESLESKRANLSIPRQRTGVLKTVGNPNHTDSPPPKLQTDIPNVDFGATQSYTPAIRNSPGGLGPQNASPRWEHSRTPSDTLTPRDERRSSYLGRISPNNDPNSRSHSHSPNPSPNPTDQALSWQPGAAAGWIWEEEPGPTNNTRRVCSATCRYQSCYDSSVSATEESVNG